MAAKEKNPQSSDFLVFDDFSGGMNTQSARQGLPKKFASWMENLQPLAPNYLPAVQSPVPAIAIIRQETVVKAFGILVAGQDYIIAFCASGACYAVTVAGAAGQLATGGTVIRIAKAGTFSAGGGDVTTFGNTVTLFADSQAGYCAWNGFAFSQAGGVSPNFAIQNGGSGYTSGALVAITGGSGTGAMAVATVTAGVVTGIVLTNAGTGYVAGDTLTVTITPVGAGSAATANGHVWPFLTPNPTTLAVAFGRVFLAAGRTLIVTGIGSSTFGAGWDDFASGDASVTTVINDSDLTHTVTALRYLENYLYIIGDNSVKSIGGISVSGTVTSFTITTLSSDQGSTFQQSIQSFDRLILFANTVGVYAVFGASVGKISDAMDGVFRAIDFSQPMQAAVNDVNNVHTYLLLVKYLDPFLGPRGLILAYFSKKWYTMNQGLGLDVICTSNLSGHSDTFGSSSNDITQLLQGNAALPFKLQTSLSHDGDPIDVKNIIRVGMAQTVAGQSDVAVTLDSELSSVLSTLAPPDNAVTWVNNLGQTVTWANNSNQVVAWSPTNAFALNYSGRENQSGRFIGSTVTGSVPGIAIQAIYLEYQKRAEWSVR